MGRVSALLAHQALVLVLVALRKPNPPTERVDSSGMFKIVCRHCPHSLVMPCCKLCPLAAPISIDNWLARKRNEGAMPTQTGGQTTMGSFPRVFCVPPESSDCGLQQNRAQGSSQHTDPSFSVGTTSTPHPDLTDVGLVLASNPLQHVACHWADSS